MHISSESYGRSSVVGIEMHQWEATLLLARPGIVCAEALAGLTAMVMASSPVHSFEPAAYGIISIILAATGAAMANSVFESKTDRKMTRLKQRCHAIEVVGRLKAAVIAQALLSLSVTIAALFVNMLTATLLIVAAATYLLLYTAWLKKSSCWGVVAGAIPGALPPLIGSAAVSGYVSTPSLMLALLIFVWQLPHFWFLALQYLDDYRQAAIPVLPATHGINLTKTMILLCVVLLIPLSLTFYIAGYSSVKYAAVSGVASIAFLVICMIDLFRLQVSSQGSTASIAYLVVILGALICDF